MSGDLFVPAHKGVSLCYRTHGSENRPAVLLIAGLGQDLTAWPETALNALVANGFRVIRYDNRDTGRSTTIDTPPPGRLRQLMARPRADAYDLADMAADAIGLLDHLGIDAAHVVGMSMGGMIAQTIASRWPERVKTLTSVFSTTGNRSVGQPTLSTIALLATPAGRTRQRAITRHLRITRHIASPEHGIDEAAERAFAERAWERGNGRQAAAGIARHVSAIHASGDRTSELAGITSPTLVIHGDRDRIVAPNGGTATAAAIPAARHVVIAGMGHHLAEPLIPQLVGLITDHVQSSPPPRNDALAPEGDAS